MLEISVRSAKRDDEPELSDTSRLEMFSDGAFAIIITLLVLEIHRPNAAQGALGKDLLDEWPSYLAYALAFIYVGVIWLNHHYLFERLQRADLTLHWINLGILGNSLIDSFSDRSAGERVSRWQCDGPEGSGGPIRSDCRNDVGSVATGILPYPL
jgi:hypothetical protein